MNRHMRDSLLGAGLLLLAAGCSPESTTRLSGTVAEVNEQTVSILPATGEGLRSFTLPGDSGTKALLPGAPVDVEYRGTYREGVEAIRIKTDTTYMEAVGSWTVPDPIAPDSAMGFELRTEGAPAQSAWQRSATTAGHSPASGAKSCSRARASATGRPSPSPRRALSPAVPTDGSRSLSRGAASATSRRSNSRAWSTKKTPSG